MPRLVPMLLVLALSSPAQAQDAGTDGALAAAPATVRKATPIEDVPAGRRPTLESWIEGDGKVALGHTVTLRVRIRHRSTDSVHLPADTGFGGLDLVDKKVDTRPDGEGWVIDDYTMILLALEPGKVTIPSLEFGAVLEKGEVVKLGTFAREVVVIDPTDGAKDATPKDIAPVVDVWQDDYTILYVLGALLGAALIALLVRHMVRNWDRWFPGAAVAPPPPRPPEDVALSKLDDLKGRGMPPDDGKKAWYIELSEIMREYVGGRYGFDGLESTTEEIIRVMRGKKTAGLTQAELFRFLNDCDMVKFAKYVPGTREDEQSLDEAYRIVRVTTPRLLPPPPGPVRSQGGKE